MREGDQNKRNVRPQIIVPRDWETNVCSLYV